MIDYETLCKIGEEAGFSKVAPLEADTIVLMPEVRDMCSQCGQYAKRWTCPPGCGTLEEYRERLSHWKKGILVQTIGELEDELDGEGMMETQQRHQETFRRFTEYLYSTYGRVMPIGAGTCDLCKNCTYPDAPCRYPQKAICSMEAMGMVVSQVCMANQVPYYYGPCTIAYTSCYLLE